MDNISQTQREKILDRLNLGIVTRDEFMYMGIACPTARVTELRKRGFNIKCEELPRINGKRRTRYILIP